MHIAHHTVPVVLDRRHLESVRERRESVRERGALALFPKWPPHAVTASELCNLQLSNRARAFSLAFAALFFRLLFSHFICSIFACEIEQNEGVIAKEKGI